MKTFLRKSAIAASLLLTLAATTFTARAQGSAFDTDPVTNVSVAITVNNANGAAFSIRNEKGAVVYKGTIRSNKTFYIPGSKLGTGTFQIYIGSQACKTFQVN